MRESRLFEKKEAFRFAFWGVVTTLANYFSFFLLQKMMAYQIANLISIILRRCLSIIPIKDLCFVRKQTGRGQ